MTPVTITYSLTADQFLAACNALWAYQGIGKNGNHLIAAVLAAASCFSVFSGSAAVFFLAPAAVFFIATGPLRNWLWRRHYASLIKYTGVISTTFRPDGIAFQSAEGDFMQSWLVFGSYTETADYIFLHVGKRKWRQQFSVIPKAALLNANDLAALRMLLMAHLPQRSRRWL